MRNRKVQFFAALVPILVFLFFVPSLFNGFVNWDDPDVILDNPLIKNLSWHAIHTILVNMWTGQYHRFIPLSMVFFTVEYHLFGTHPFGYHLVSVLFHCLNSLGVFIFVYLLSSGVGAAFFAAMLFGLHPLQVEPVVWIAAGHYPIGAFFFLCSVILYLKRLEGMSFFAFFLALLFYSLLALPLPLILLAIDYYGQGVISWQNLYRKVPFFILSLYFGWLTLQAAHHTEANYVPFFLAHQLPLSVRLNLSSESLWLYGQKFLIPYHLSCYYPVIYYFHKGLFLYTLLGGAVLFLVARLRRHKELRICVLGLAWFLLTMVPFLHIYGVGESIIYNRYLYIPSIGILLMLIGIGRSLRLKEIARWAAFVWIIGILLLSSCQIALWRDSGILWTNFIAQYPQFPDGYLNRSDYYLTMDKPRLALRDTDTLLKIYPQNAPALQNRGHAYLELRQWQAEIEAYTKVIELNPGFTSIYVDRGTAYYMLGKDDLALNDYNRALRQNPLEVNALFNRGMVYFYDKEYRHSLIDFHQVVLIDPSNDLAKGKIADIEHILSGRKYEN